MMELAGKTITAKDITEISDDEISLTEDQLAEIPFSRKCLIENKVHVMDFDNKLVLKAVNLKSIEDITPPKLNNVKDYDKDGGDASKMNKKMRDNEELQEAGGPPYRDEEVKKATDLLHKKRSPLANVDVEKDVAKSKKEKEEEEYKELLKKKKEKEEAEKVMSKGDKFSLTKENAEDATVFAGNKFSKEDEEDYYGLPEVRDSKINMPASVKADAKRRIKEIRQSIKDYDDKGYNDGAGRNSNKNKAIDAIEQIMDNLSSKDYEGFREAQLFFLTLMSPITDLFPASLVNFLSGSTGDSSNSDTEIVQKVEPFETELKESAARPLRQILEESKKGRRAKMSGKNPCWDGYEMVGHKTQNGKKVPNCVPIDKDTE